MAANRRAKIDGDEGSFAGFAHPDRTQAKELMTSQRPKQG